ncbi:helix-turn-helix domain-containing protein [Flagellimonas allohymeniacidonis]|uniref:XRE family transcriptional regulator n=1 Tax=Flagellimonas allohymeniacidonis TaxID=2517819 RepID=A0A4V2HSG0_9FLAO|nr:helix-turn-helix transcriptional regulator [Allomuricauda hymeniacidonis]TAI47640.1 XRE family transcriptional regulator [Allomuricauda hymeniacidonis]
MRRKYTEEDLQFLKKFGEHLLNLREKARLSQAALETDAKMSKNQIGRIERGEISTSITNLNLIANALGMELKDLFDFS